MEFNFYLSFSEAWESIRIINRIISFCSKYAARATPMLQGQNGKILCRRHYLAKIPKEIHFLHSHVRNSGCRPNDKHGTPGSSAKGNKLPELWVLRKRCQVIHPHCCCDERNVVYNCWDHSDCTCNQFDIWDMCVKVIRQIPQDSSRLQATKTNIQQKNLTILLADWVVLTVYQNPSTWKQ